MTFFKKLICKVIGHKLPEFHRENLAILGHSSCERCKAKVGKALTQEEKDNFDLEFYGLRRRANGTVTMR